MTEADENAQLAMYQLAVASGGFEGVQTATGASLVYLGDGRKDATERAQGPVEPDEGKSRLGAVVDTMTSATFAFRLGDHCRTCPVMRSCPGQPQGREVTES